MCTVAATMPMVHALGRCPSPLVRPIFEVLPVCCQEHLE